MRKGSLRQWSEFIASTLVDNKQTVKVANIVVARLAAMEEHRIVAVAVMTRRLCGVDIPKFWTYSKPNITPPNLEEISESAAAMHCIDIDLLDVLLICNGLDYDFDKAAEFLRISNVKEQYIAAMQKIFSLIEFAPEATPKQKEDTLIALIKSICDEIGLFASEKAMVYFFKYCINNTQSFVKRCVRIIGEKIKTLLSKLNKDSSVEKRGTITSRISKQLREKRSIILTGIICCITTLAIAWAVLFSSGLLSKQKYKEYENSLDSSVGGVCYELTYLPFGYILDEYTITPLKAKAVFKDPTGNSIIFTQQVKDEPIKEFDSLRHYSYAKSRNRNVAISETVDSTELLWFNENYLYSLSAPLEKNVLFDVADGVKLDIDSAYPTQYTEYLAEENGDIIENAISKQAELSIKRLTQSFADDKSDSVRIVSYEKGAPIITTVRVDSTGVYCIKDERRTLDDDMVIESGKRYDTIEEIYLQKDELSLVAKTISTGEILVLLRY